MKSWVPALLFAAAATLACSDSSGPGSSQAFSFRLALPGRSPLAVGGDSSYWEVLQGPATDFSAFLTSPDSVDPTPPPINFYLIQSAPPFQGGYLAPGTYSLNINEPSPINFSISYTGANIVADSGTLTIMSSGIAMVLKGQVAAWVHQYQPTNGPAFLVTGTFTIKPKT
jgi:hypothetical protein